MIKFICSGCKQIIGAAQKDAGKLVRCPMCKTPVYIPQPTDKSEIQLPVPVKFHCPKCDQKIGVTADYAGKRVRCPRCKNIVRVPQVSTRPLRPAGQNETAVLRAGHQPRSTDRQTQSGPQNTDELLLEPMSTPDTEKQTEYSLAEPPAPEPELSAHTLGPPQPGSSAQTDAVAKPPGKKRRTIFTAIACVFGLLLLSSIAWYFLAGSRTSESDAQLLQAQKFAEDYIHLLEAGEIDRAEALLSPGLQSDVDKDDIEKFAEQLGKSRIVGLDRGLTHFEPDPEANRFYLEYNLRSEDDSQSVIVSVLQIDEEFTVDAIAGGDPLGETVSLGSSSYEQLEGVLIGAVVREKFESLISIFVHVILPVLLLAALVQVVSMWIVFDKAGEPGWAALVPFYNMWVMAEVGDKPGWWGLLACFCGAIPLVGPVAQLVFFIIISIGVARAFNRGIGFGIGLALLPFIFFPILAFSGN